MVDGENQTRPANEADFLFMRMDANKEVEVIFMRIIANMYECEWKRIFLKLFIRAAGGSFMMRRIFIKCDIDQQYSYCNQQSDYHKTYVQIKKGLFTHISSLLSSNFIASSKNMIAMIVWYFNENNPWSVFNEMKFGVMLTKAIAPAKILVNKPDKTCNNNLFPDNLFIQNSINNYSSISNLSFQLNI